MISALRYSLIASALLIGIRLSVYFAHAQFTPIGVYSNLIGLLLTGAPLFFYLRSVRELNPEEHFGVKHVLKSGLIFAALNGLVVAIFTWAYFKYIDHETLAGLIDMTREYLKDGQKTITEVEEAIAGLKNFYSPFNQATGALMGAIISGAVLSLIFSGFLASRVTR